MLIYLPFCAAALYLLAALVSLSWPERRTGLSLLAWCVHGAALWAEIFSGSNLKVGFAAMLSAAMWVTVAVYLMENRNLALDGLKFLLFPPVAMLVLLPVFFPGNHIELNGKTTMFPWHIGIALLAYGTLTIAAFHAAIMSIQDRHLHRLRGQSMYPLLNTAIDKLPALLTMEKILFRLIWIGFILLTLTVLSGVVFSEQVLGIAFKWDHKTILSMMSWLLFAVLLVGRHWRGWRGKTVLSFTLSGFVMLLLAYVGSRFVLEVLLHRSLT